MGHSPGVLSTGGPRRTVYHREFQTAIPHAPALWGVPRSERMDWQNGCLLSVAAVLGGAVSRMAIATYPL